MHQEPADGEADMGKKIRPRAKNIAERVDPERSNDGDTDYDHTNIATATNKEDAGDSG